MYWWDGHPNFGDALTPWVLARYGIVAVHAPLSRARVVGIGSLVDQLPDEFAGVIWGSGLLREAERRLPAATALAVRGPLTRERLGLDDGVALGDPGLLIGRHVRRRTPQWPLGVVPHGLHHADPVLRELGRRRGVRVVDVRSTPSVVMEQISRCAAVVTTSLHGLIVADALGIPAAWARRRPPLWGDDFKFRDYEAVVSPGRSREIDIQRDLRPAEIVRVCGRPDARAVEAATTAIEATIADLPAVPSSIWAEHLTRRRKN
ncbi:polysaccharide pyruvyl transferase family protein [Janibacter hoylei]|uniref:polysaccharide pyruvyl transferase family protein n=1 Tax=Janibacter hoylei TaxID=364298 RepID=UPI0027B8B31A|nr:polysaccharide pyruvyl transferase family protein [Janibacter hoylei]